MYFSCHAWSSARMHKVPERERTHALTQKDKEPLSVLRGAFLHGRPVAIRSTDSLFMARRKHVGCRRGRVSRWPGPETPSLAIWADPANRPESTGVA